MSVASRPVDRVAERRFCGIVGHVHRVWSPAAKKDMTIPHVTGLTRLRCSVSEFEALCANDGELGELRASIRDFVTADRAAYGWEPAVDSWLAKWDPAFSARLAEA